MAPTGELSTETMACIIKLGQENNPTQSVAKVSKVWCKNKQNGEVMKGKQMENKWVKQGRHQSI